MKYLFSFIALCLICPLTASGQVSLSTPEASVQIDDTLSLPINLNVLNDSTVSGIHIKFDFNAEEFEFLGLNKNESISDSILSIANSSDSTIILSFASAFSIKESGVLTHLVLKPKKIGLATLELIEVRFDENETQFPNSVSGILITDELGNTPPFIIDIPDTLFIDVGESLVIELENYFGDFEDDFSDLIIDASFDGIVIGVVLNPIDNTLILTAPEEEETGTFNLTITDSDGSTLEISIVIVVRIVVSNEDFNNQEKEFALSQNYPNPFNPSTEIAFTLPSSSLVKLSVYNLLGQEVATLLNEVKVAGIHKATFDASLLSSGVYIYRIQAGEFVQTKRMMLIK